MPNAIVVSYNGQLDIKEDHFNEIIRNMTIIADHRVLLFPNMSAIFRTKPEEAMEEEEEMKDGESYVSKYSNYEFDRINQ